MRERRVSVTRHAFDQARSRFPEFDVNASSIEREVREAFSQGRVRRRKPRWLGRRRAEGNKRFLWTENRERTYVVEVACDRLIVVTVLSRQPREAVA